MPRNKLLVSALALALSGATVAQAQSFSGVVSFGDSLSDAGQYAALPPPYYFGAQGRFTTNPDDVWTQVLANSFGFTQTASLAGGSSYAWGGAPTGFTVPGVTLPGTFTIRCVPSTLPCQSVAQQIAAHGAIDPNALYTYWAGANDIFNYIGYAGASIISGAQAQAFTGASALNAVAQIGGLQAAGAKVIVVLNLPDIGRAPNFTNATLFPSEASPANAASVSGLVFVYNSTFNAGLASLGDGIVSINTYGLINEILADPLSYGFSNTTGTACNLALTGGSSLFCTPAAYRSADANLTYLFADGVHPTGGAFAMLAKVVLATISAPGQVSMAGELPLQLYDDHSSVLNGQIFGIGNRAREIGDTNVYGAVQSSRQKFDAAANTGAMDNDAFTGTFGADVRHSDRFSFGAAVSFGNAKGDAYHASIDGKEVLLSAYAVAHMGAGYINLIASGGSNSLEINRSIDFGPTTRVERGDTSASHQAFELGAGFAFGDDDFHHGPFASLTWQKVEVDGYIEDSLDSTSMYFNGFTRKSSVGRIGYQAQGSAGRWQPYGRVAFARDSKDNATAVQAGSNSMNGHFTLDGFQAPKDWVEADVGISYALSDATSFSFSYRARLSDDTQSRNSVGLTLRKTFGKAVVPVEVQEPEPMPEPQKTCADMDDDGDGVNNCDDKCADSAAGQSIGPDGCPVPLTIDLNGVNFDFDRSTLRPDAVAILDEAIAILSKYPELKVAVAGHTDSMGDEAYNQGLSESRARTVYDYLTSHGIDASRLVGPQGFGESQPIDSNETREGRARNRRTELDVQN